jgi:tetratricopeptide (TPR) repeat protein
VYFAQQDYAAALADFSKAIELQPENGDNYHWRGRVYQDMQDYPAALADFSKAIDLQPENGNNYFWRSLVFLETGDTAAALQDLDKAHELKSDDSGDLLWRGVGHRLLGNEEAAQADWQRATELLQQEEQNDNWHTKAGRLALLQGDLDTAREHYTQFLPLTTPPEARNQLEHLQRLARLFPARADIRELSEWLAAQLSAGGE